MLCFLVHEEDSSCSLFVCVFDPFFYEFFMFCVFFTLILFWFKPLFLVSFLVQIFYGLVEPMLRVNLDR
jgi:hypothetical protein